MAYDTPFFDIVEMAAQKEEVKRIRSAARAIWQAID
jgi:hypothetical protein